MSNMMSSYLTNDKMLGDEVVENYEGSVVHKV